MKKEIIDICCGKMTLKSVNREIVHYMTQYPKYKRLVVDIRRKEDGYYATFWIKKSDFDGG